MFKKNYATSKSSGSLKTNKIEYNINPIQDWLFGTWSRMGGGQKRFPLPNICHTYPETIKLGTVIPYLKKIQKIYESCGTANLLY